MMNPLAAEAEWWTAFFRSSTAATRCRTPVPDITKLIAQPVTNRRLRRVRCLGHQVGRTTCRDLCVALDWLLLAAPQVGFSSFWRRNEVGASHDSVVVAAEQGEMTGTLDTNFTATDGLGTPDPDGCRAVLIGVSDYESGTLPRLPAVLNNLSDLFRALTHWKWGLLAEKQCETLCNPTDATKLLRRVGEHAAGATDTLVVYYAGHGIPDDGSQLLLSLTNTDTEYNTSALAFRHLVDACRKSPARKKVFIVDCCFSGRALGVVDPASLTIPSGETGTYVLTSAATNQSSFAPEGAPHTAFTGALLHLLHHGLEGGPELLDLRTIYDALSVSLPHRDFPRPHQSTIDEADRTILVRNRSHDVTSQEPTVVPGKVTSDELVELRALCRRLSHSALVGLYRHTVGDLGPSLRSGMSGAGAVIDQLAGLMVDPGQPPLVLWFAIHAADALDGDLLHRVIDWTSRVATRLGYGPETLESMRAHARAAVTKLCRCYLVVQLNPSPMRAGRYHLSVRLHRDEGIPEPCYDEDPAMSLSEIESRIAGLLPTFLEGVAREDVTIEFLVPRELIGYGFDQWLAGRDRLGVLYPVVVCDLERPGRNTPDVEWRNRWIQLQGAVEGSSTNGVIWLDSIFTPEPAAYRAALLRRNGWVCLAVESPCASVDVEMLLGEGLALGAPAAIWRRNGVGSDGAVSEILRSAALVTLPAYVLERRQEAVETQVPDHCGHHLSLLWDDPDRRPPVGRQLAAPRS
jgi:NTP-dependent ternary conflict system VMAP-like protein/caspase domain-containing protein